MKIRNYLILVFLSSLCTIHTKIIENKKPSWTFFIYMEASLELQDMAFKTINDIAANHPDPSINLFALIHAYGETAWLYKISKNTVHLIHEIPIETQSYKTILQEIKPVFSSNPADYYGVILWDHGTGILIPKYNPITDEWDVEADGQNDTELSACTNNECFIKKGHAIFDEHHNHRGMLKNDVTKTCMNNQEMVELFKTISTEALNGKKLDVCGLDMCLGAMVEHGYQLRNYVHYLIGSQDCELKDGWDFCGLMHSLGTVQDIIPAKLAQEVVAGYKTYYDIHAPIGRYTQSALDLSYMDELKDNLDNVIDCLRSCPGYASISFKEVIRTVRKKSTRFCLIPAYADLHNIYCGVLHEISHLYEINNHTKIKLLEQYLHEGCALIEKLVVANITGSKVADAKGISLYFPLQNINSGYRDTLFAKESHWLSFLQEIIV